MPRHCSYIATLASIGLLLGCATAPAAKPGPAAAPSSTPSLSEPRQIPYELSVILPLLPEPSPAEPSAAPPPAVASAAEKAAAAPGPSSLESAQPPIEASPHRASPKVAAFDPAAVKLPAPALPQALAAAPQAKPAAAASAAQASKAAKPAAAPAAKPKASAQAPAKKAEPEAAQLPSFASTPSSSTPVADPAAARQPDIAQRVNVEIGSRVEIPLDGTGWTYLGEKDGKDGVLYESRRYEGAGLVFVLNTTRTGDYVLRFQRQDALRGKSYDELVGVTVLPRAVKSSQAPDQSAPSAAAATAASAPASKSAAAAAPGAAPASMAAMGQQAASDASAASTAGGAAQGQAGAQAGAASPLPDSPEGLLLAAKNELQAGRVPGAIAALDRFLSLYPAGMDEVYYLYGQALEQNGPYKDIQKAYSYYKKVGDDYPESPLWDKARERASYIERHYFEIR